MGYVYIYNYKWIEWCKKLSWKKLCNSLDRVNLFVNVNFYIVNKYICIFNFIDVKCLERM